MPTDPILQYSVLNGALIIVAMTAIIIIITVLSIFGHIGIMYSIFYIKKMSKVGGLETMGKTSLRPIKALFFLLHHDVSYKHRRCWRSAWSPSSMPAAPAPCPFSSALMKRSGFWGGESWGVQSKNQSQAPVRADQPSIIGVGSSFFLEHVAPTYFHRLWFTITWRISGCNSLCRLLEDVASACGATTGGASSAHGALQVKRGLLALWVSF